MNEIQQIQLKILIKLDEVCKRHQLKYYLAYGTCIGAIRHSGFIPWDHDIDVLMPFDDAKKLIKYQSEFEPEYFVSHFSNDQDNLTTKLFLIDKSRKCRVINKGRIIETGNVGIDIYPFYNCPPSSAGLLMNIIRSHEYKILVGGIPKNHGKLAKILATSVLWFIPPSKRRNRIQVIENKLNYKGRSVAIADYYGKDIALLSAITYDKEWFSQPKEIEFEGYKFWGPTDPDKYLTKRYGDYMTPVSAEDIENEVKIELI